MARLLRQPDDTNAATTQSPAMETALEQTLRPPSISPKSVRRLTLDVVAEEFHDVETDL